jgi:hypothetical protein
VGEQKQSTSRLGAGYKAAEELNVGVNPGASADSALIRRVQSGPVNPIAQIGAWVRGILNSNGSRRSPTTVYDRPHQTRRP